MIVTVVPANGHEPRPTGDIIVSGNGNALLTVPLLPGLRPLTATTPLLNGKLAALGQRVAIGYSGDNNYEASDGMTITVPTSRSLLTITTRPRDSASPAIEIVSPGDGAAYERGESVLATYSCKDPDTRSPVTSCEGPVPGVLALGGLTTGDDVRFMLGLGALWAVVPVLAGVTRPLRRPPTSGVVGLWDRGADFLVVSLIGAWTVQRIVLALPGLAGVELEIADYADEIALFVLGALVVRLALETLASHFYPLRLDSTAASAFPDPSKLTLIGSALGAR